jgi:hypothetical protein
MHHWPVPAVIREYDEVSRHGHTEEDMDAANIMSIDLDHRPKPKDQRVLYGCLHKLFAYIAVDSVTERIQKTF